ncbi:MAG: ComEA family DNA-binding protein [Candidatus Poribacteria bacterium]|nr:ComEA family DNA-binding protein [Candidatus Poribacteria bacterium]
MNFDDSNYRKIAICLVAVILLGVGFWILKRRHPELFLGEPDLVVDSQEKVDESSPPTESSIPSADAESAAPSEPTPHESNDGRIDINAATAEEFESLPGIGPAIAERIVDYRSVNGRFDVIEDLTEVSGIGDKTIQKLRDRLVVR